MLGAIKLPSSGVSQNKFFNGRYPMSRLLGPNHLEVSGAVEPQRGINQLSSSVYANKTLPHRSGNQHIWIKTASTAIENLNTLNEHHLLIFL